MSRAMAALVCFLFVVGCSQDQQGARDRGLPDATAADLLPVDLAADLPDSMAPDNAPDVLGTPPCAKAPCAARGIIFIQSATRQRVTALLGGSF